MKRLLGILFCVFGIGLVVASGASGKDSPVFIMFDGGLAVVLAFLAFGIAGAWDPPNE